MEYQQPEWLAAWHEIQVDAASVEQLAATLSFEVRGNLEPQVDKIYQGYSSGTPFGTRSPSIELHAVRKRYNGCLTNTVEQLAAYVHGSSILVAAAMEIAFRYRTADELAAVKVEEIGLILANAVTRATQVMDGGAQAGVL